MILSMHLSTVAAQSAAKPALHFLGKTTSYAELRDSIGRLSYLFQNELGAAPRVAILGSNAPAIVKTVFAVSNIKGVLIPVDPSLSDEEVADWIRDGQATHLAITSDLIHRARDLVARERLSIPIVEVEKKRGGEYDTSFTPPAENTPADTDVVVLFRTAGATGKARMVGMSHTQLHHAAVSLRRSYRGMPTDRYLSTINWSNPFAFIHSMLFPLLTGSTAVCHYGLEGNDFLDFLLDAKITRLVDHPRFFRKLLYSLKNSERKSLPGIKSVTVGQGILAPELQKAFRLLKINVAHCYGQTEMGWTISMEEASPEGELPPIEKPGSGLKGLGLAGLKYKVIDQAGDTIEGSQARLGQLAVSGPSIMTGYKGPEKQDNEDATRDKLRGTWLYTGDIAQLEDIPDSVRITFFGRESDVLWLENKVHTPEAVDYVLRDLRGIQDGAGFVTKSEMGKKIMAVAVIRISGAKLSENDVLAHCRSKLSAGAEPVIAFFVDEIPRSSSGAVERFRLARQFSGLYKG